MTGKKQDIVSKALRYNNAMWMSHIRAAVFQDKRNKLVDQMTQEQYKDYLERGKTEGVERSK